MVFRDPGTFSAKGATSRKSIVLRIDLKNMSDKRKLLQLI